MKRYDHLLKIIVIGNSAIGKSSLLLRYADYGDVNKNLKFEISRMIPTIGVDFKIKYVNRNDGLYKLQMWDTAGQETYRSITKAYYRNVNVYMVCFDSTHTTDLACDDIVKWIQDIIEYTTDDIMTIYLVGTKIDNIKSLDMYSTIIEFIENIINECSSLNCTLNVVGLCSSIRNEFVRYNTFKTLNHIVKDVPYMYKLNVTDMFDIILDDYVDNVYVNTEEYNVNVDTINVVSKKKCCILL
jgi:small GTP-binding protein